MADEESILNSLYIAAPCDVEWNDMSGDDRSRFCSQCKLNVYNFSVMSTNEVVSLIKEKEGKLCGRIYRRFDGTVITDNCPVGLRRVRQTMKAVAAFVLIAICYILACHPTLAQGLVGAPVDPRYGGEGGGEVGQIPDFNNSSANWMQKALDFFGHVAAINALWLQGHSIKTRHLFKRGSEFLFTTFFLLTSFGLFTANRLVWSDGITACALSVAGFLYIAWFIETLFFKYFTDMSKCQTQAKLPGLDMRAMLLCTALSWLCVAQHETVCAPIVLIACFVTGLCCFAAGLWNSAIKVHSINSITGKTLPLAKRVFLDLVNIGIVFGWVLLSTLLLEHAGQEILAHFD